MHVHEWSGTAWRYDMRLKTSFAIWTYDRAVNEISIGSNEQSNSNSNSNIENNKVTHKTHCCRPNCCLLWKRDSMAITHMPIAMKCNQMERIHTHTQTHTSAHMPVLGAGANTILMQMFMVSKHTAKKRTYAHLQTDAWIDKMPHNPYNSCVILIKANRIYYA